MNHKENINQANANSKSIAAVIVTYNRQESLEQVLNAIKNQTRALDEIIVVDNANSIDTKTMIEKNFPGTTYYPQSSNLGSDGGHSAGMRLACEHKHHWIWLMDDDTIPDSSTLENCLKVAERLEDQRLGVVSPARTGNGRVFGFGSLWRDRTLPAPGNIRSTPWYDVDISGSIGALLPRKVLLQVGFPRTDYFMQWWEAEYSLRLKKAGFRIVKIPIPYITHIDDWQGISVPWRDCYYGTRNWLVMALEHHSATELFWWMVYQTKATAAIILYGDSKTERLRLRLLGTWHGLRHKMGKTIDPARYSNKKHVASAKQS